MSDLGVLVLSCDRYRGLWDLFFTRWERFWPECPYPVYLLSNQIDYDRTGVSTVKTGKDLDWSSNLLNVLDRLPQDNLLLMMEDAPLDAPVDGLAFERMYKRFQNEGLNYLNLKASPAPNGVCDIEMGELLPGSLYRTALIPCIWKKDVLKKLAIRGETAWHFEILGSERSDHIPKFWSTKSPSFSFLHCIVRGKLDRRAARILMENGELQSLGFPIMTLREQISLRLRELRSRIFTILIPSRLRRDLRGYFYRNIVGKGRIV